MSLMVNEEKYKANNEVAYLAGGCFWCMEVDFLKIEGVINVESGYMGGDKKNPTYDEICTGITGHAETIKITFDPKKISYDDLLKIFLLNIDPTVKDRQFCDVGNQYRTAIFYVNDTQKKAAQDSLLWLIKTFPNIKPLVEINQSKEFYLAEDYHQRFYKKNPLRYNTYRSSCGRDERLLELYGDKRLEILHSFYCDKKPS